MKINGEDLSILKEKNSRKTLLKIVITFLLIIIIFTLYEFFFIFKMKSDYNFNQEILNNGQKYEKSIYIKYKDEIYACVYGLSYQLDNVDIGSFKVLDSMDYSNSYVAVDKNNVYFGNQIVSDLDPNKLYTVGNDYYSDGINSYFCLDTFEKNEDLKSLMTEKQWADFINFEGNANAIRVLTHQQRGKDKGGLQLTMATLASIAKYPCESIAKDKKQLHRKKFGFFQSEKETFREIAKATTFITEQEEPLVYKRHPFVWLVEAADDICYNIIDIEDAHRLKIISSSDCENLILELIKTTDENIKRVEDKLSVISDKNDRISYLRAKVINSLINVSIRLYKDKFDDILTGNLDQSLLSIFKKENKTLQDIKQFSIDEIYNHRAVVEIENAGYNVMYELLNHFIPSAIKENPKDYDKKALQLLPEQFRYDGEPYEKIMGVLDFVSGMTDNYATDLYRKIKGIDIGMTM